MSYSAFGGHEENPGLDCITRGHIWMCVTRDGELWVRMKPWPPDDKPAALSWCPWCGTGSYDSDLDPQQLRLKPGD